MSYLYSIRTVTEDRDLSRAAAERSSMLQAVAERRAAARTSHPGRSPIRLLRYLRTLRSLRSGPRPAVAAKPAPVSMVE